jgi:hypothetical protein
VETEAEAETDGDQRRRDRESGPVTVHTLEIADSAAAAHIARALARTVLLRRANSQLIARIDIGIFLFSSLVYARCSVARGGERTICYNCLN